MLTIMMMTITTATAANSDYGRDDGLPEDCR